MPAPTPAPDEAAAVVLVVDDDPGIRRALGRGLRLAGYDVRLAADGRAALETITGAEAPDVVVLDVTLPYLSGTEVCRRTRAAGLDTPVLMLSARDETADRISGLQAGADDYLVKPFDLQELDLRLRALLRRRAPAPVPESTVRSGPVELDPACHAATCDGIPLTLTRREFALLEVFVRNTGIVMTRDQLLDRVWGYDFDVRTDVVDTFVSYLRRKLETDGRPRLVHTVRGVGFVFRVPAAERRA